MNVLSWVLQIVAATVFLYSGSLKSWMSKERMIATGQTGVAPYPLPVLRVVAVAATICRTQDRTFIGVLLVCRDG